MTSISISRHLTERLINETKSFIEKNLIKERKELLERMQKNVNFLKEDQTEILNELSENSQQIRKILEQIRVEGSIIDADKLKLHIDELESVTSLLTVLKVRLKAAENKLEVTKDSKDKVIYLERIPLQYFNSIFYNVISRPSLYSYCPLPLMTSILKFQFK